jgi:hypothetical protein
MPIELTLPITAVSALALAAALSFTGWLPLPRIRLRAQNEKHGPLRVIELALVMSPALAARQPGVGPARRATEFVVYINLKTCHP